MAEEDKKTELIGGDSNKYGSEGIDPGEFAMMMGRKPAEQEVEVKPEQETEVVQEIEQEIEAEQEVEVKQEIESEFEPEPIKKEESKESSEKKEEVEELTPEERYNTLLEMFNKLAKENLDLKSRGPYKATEVEKIEGKEEVTEVKKEEPKVEQLKVQAEPVTFESLKVDQLISREELKKAVMDDDDELLANLLVSSYQGLVNGVGKYLESRIEGFYRTAPRMMQSLAREQIDLQEARNNFYKNNPDLEQYQAIVGTVSMQVFAENPGKPLPELMQEVETQSRKVLGLKKSIASPSSRGNETPAFVRGKHKREPVKEQLKGLQAEMAEMLKANQSR